LLAPTPPIESEYGLPEAQYQVYGGKWPQPGGLNSPVTLTYSYQNMFDGGLRGPDNVPLPASLIRASIERALGLWAEVAPLTFVEVPDDHILNRGEYAGGQFGQIRFRHVYINGPDIPGQAPIAKAQAYFPTVGLNLPGDVEFDHGDPWQEFGTLSNPDILGAATHEVGHSLGLLHTNLSDANMYWIFRRTQGLGDAWLHPDDIAGVRAIYGTGSGRVVPLVIPEPTTWVLMIGTIFVCHCWLAQQCRRHHIPPVLRAGAP
jgi:hypothetical protein